MEQKIIKEYWKQDWNVAFGAIAPKDLARLLTTFNSRSIAVFQERAMQDPPTQLKELAERFSVSPAHISKIESTTARKIITMAQKEGLLPKL